LFNIAEYISKPLSQPAVVRKHAGEIIFLLLALLARAPLAWLSIGLSSPLSFLRFQPPMGNLSCSIVGL
jgi:hypothetical protein